MKLFLVFLMFIFSVAATAVEFPVNVGGQRWIVTGTYYHQLAHVLSLDGFRMTNADTGEQFLVNVGPGWGATPLNVLCEALSGGAFPFAKIYGNLDSPSLFDPGTVLVFEPNSVGGTFKSFSFSDKSMHSLVYTRLQCTAFETSYY